VIAILLWELFRWAVLIGAIAPLGYYAMATVAALRFFGRPDPPSDFVPPLSILKPVKGLDREAYENYASFCRQDYPNYEILLTFPMMRIRPFP